MRFITDSSFSAVGLFLGFLVRDTLTKLWKAADLRNETVGMTLVFRSKQPQRRKMMSILEENSNSPFVFFF